MLVRMYPKDPNAVIKKFAKDPNSKAKFLLLSKLEVKEIIYDFFLKQIHKFRKPGGTVDQNVLDQGVILGPEKSAKNICVCHRMYVELRPYSDLERLF